MNGADRKKHLMSLPLFAKASETFGAQIWHVDDEFDPAAKPRKSGTTETDADDAEDAPTTDEI